MRLAVQLLPAVFPGHVRKGVMLAHAVFSDTKKSVLKNSFVRGAVLVLVVRTFPSLLLLLLASSRVMAAYYVFLPR